MTTKSRAHAARTEHDSRWAAVRARDPRADAMFVYSVRTTGVYCKPSCGARLARPENVAFHADPRAAEAAGFRACKRCKPDAPSSVDERVMRVAQLCRFIERSPRIPTLDALAEQVGLSGFHTHRIFKAVTGVTPRVYAAQHRARRVRDALRASASVTQAVYDAGYDSMGRFYAAADQQLGMTPRAYQARGAQTRIRFAIGECSLGAILVAATARGVCTVALGDDPQRLVRELEQRFARAELIGGDAAFEALVAQVVGVVEGTHSAAALPLDIRGTAFQARVWRALSRIPSGETRTYTELARAIGAPEAVRALASACGANPLAVLIPCHRVVRKGGALAGYRWGVERKCMLLAREAERR